MPLKNEKPFCINHPDEKMSLVQSDKEKGAYHGLLFIKPVKTDEGIQYSAISEVTPVKLFVCKICGYSESYLVDPELEQPGGID